MIKLTLKAIAFDQVLNVLPLKLAKVSFIYLCIKKSHTKKIKDCPVWEVKDYSVIRWLLMLSFYIHNRQQHVARCLHSSVHWEISVSRVLFSQSQDWGLLFSTCSKVSHKLVKRLKQTLTSLTRIISGNLIFSKGV